MGFFDRLREVLREYDMSKQTTYVATDTPSEEQEDKALFNESLDFVFAMEGGYSNDPYDPGGKTKYGISHRAYPSLDIENLTLDDAKAIYYKDYWLGSGAKVASISPKLAMIMFDTAVNMGVGTAMRFLQRVLHVKEDGVFGPTTKYALEVADIGPTIDWYMTNRMLRYTELEGWSRYRRGWTQRLMSLSRISSKVEASD